MPLVSTEIDFSERLLEAGALLGRKAPRTLQLNLGKLCNLTCAHCHVNAGPSRKEIMEEETLARIVSWVSSAPSIEVFDLTGGAPEMNPRFNELVTRLRELRPDATLIDRCNLTILLEPGYESLAKFLADHRVQVVASMPCYQPENVNVQRGDGVFDASIEALRLLNGLGYGSRHDLELNLVYNPIGASLPPDQSELERDYKEALKREFGIEFNRLFAIANMPIARFLTQLKRAGALESYQQLLVEAFNPAAVEGLMCCDTISVDWRGRVYDCDFNQMLDMPLAGDRRRYVWELDLEEVAGLPIATGSHCFGCTAGAGSSCGGALSD